MSNRGRSRTIAVTGQPSAPVTVRKESGGDINLWYFHSPKNRRRYVFCGELVFLVAILLEADREIESYGAPCAADYPDKIAPHLLAFRTDGGQVAYFTQYTDGSARKRSETGPSSSAKSDLAETTSIIVTDKVLRDRQVEIENWIFLCAAMNRARQLPGYVESDVLRALTTDGRPVSFATLLNQERVDKACMLAVIGNSLQRGAIFCDTKSAPLSLSSMISKARPS